MAARLRIVDESFQHDPPLDHAAARKDARRFPPAPRKGWKPTELIAKNARYPRGNPYVAVMENARGEIRFFYSA